MEVRRGRSGSSGETADGRVVYKNATLLSVARTHTVIDRLGIKKIVSLRLQGLAYKSGWLWSGADRGAGELPNKLPLSAMASTLTREAQDPPCLILEDKHVY